MIPLATTRISVLRVAAPDEYAEPYSGDDTAARTVVASGVRAVIGRPTGTEQLAGGEQSVEQFQLQCDPVDIVYTDTVRDEADQVVYRVVWSHTYPGEVTEAGLRVVRGDV